MKNYFLIFLLIHSVNSNPINQDDCSICQFDEYFNPSNGYGCTKMSDNQTLCTCPDHQSSTINQPCRICYRKGICGSQTDRCSEKSTSFNTINNNKGYFACFCSSNIYLIGEKCPEEPIVDYNTTTVVISKTTNIINVTTTSIIDMTNTNTISLITQIKDNNTTSMKQPTTTTTTIQIETECKNRSSSLHLCMKSMLIVLLSLVYFVNK